MVHLDTDFNNATIKHSQLKTRMQNYPQNSSDVSLYKKRPNFVNKLSLKRISIFCKQFSMILDLILLLVRKTNVSKKHFFISTNVTKDTLFTQVSTRGGHLILVSQRWGKGDAYSREALFWGRRSLNISRNNIYIIRH